MTAPYATIHAVKTASHEVRLRGLKRVWAKLRGRPTSFEVVDGLRIEAVELRSEPFISGLNLDQPQAT